MNHKKAFTIAAGFLGVSTLFVLLVPKPFSTSVNTETGELAVSGSHDSVSEDGIQDSTTVSQYKIPKEDLDGLRASLGGLESRKFPQWKWMTTSDFSPEFKFCGALNEPNQAADSVLYGQMVNPEKELFSFYLINFSKLTLTHCHGSW